MSIRFFLRLYPRDHQEMFGAEMAAVLEQAAEERRARGRAAYAWFLLWEAAGLMAGAAALWAARLAGPSRIEAAPEAPPNTIRETEQLIQRSIDCMVSAIAHHQFAKARFYSQVERKLRLRLEQLRGE